MKLTPEIEELVYDVEDLLLIAQTGPGGDDEEEDFDTDDDFEETYGDLDNGHDDLATPDSDKGVDNLE